MEKENEKGFELLEGEKYVTLKKVLETILEVILLASAVVGVFALVWGKWLTLRICITVALVILLGVGVYAALTKEGK